MSGKSGSSPRATRRMLWAIVLVTVGVAVAAFHTPLEKITKAAWNRMHPADVAERTLPEGAVTPSLLELVSGQPDTVRFPNDTLKVLEVETAEVTPAPPLDPLKLPGQVSLDFNSLVRVHARFGGEVVDIGKYEPEHDVPGSAAARTPRNLRYGDKVRKGQVLAVVWSKEIGEKKSELVNALATLEIDRSILERLEKVESGVVAKTRIDEVRKSYETDLISVQRIERTLRSWHLDEEEIVEVQQEAKLIHERKSDDRKRVDKSWAEYAIRSTLDGTIVEKSFNVGDLVDASQDLFKIADLSRIQIMANVYEEDLPAIRALPHEMCQWRIDLKVDPHDVPIPGRFETIGALIDPQQHTGILIGWLENVEGKLSSGQFITATIDLPIDPGLVAVPVSALIEEGNSNTVLFVETNAERHEFTLRKVAVFRRGRDLIYVHSDPPPLSLKNGAQRLRAGERVITTSVLEVAAELNRLKSSAGH